MKSIFIFLLITSFAIAQESKQQTPTPEEARKEILNELFSRLDSQTFDQAVKKAQQNGIPQQMILEARFLHYIDQDNRAALAKLAPELEEYSEKFNLDLSEVFGVKEDWLSVVQYTKAMAALEQRDNTAFKKHITEAFWLNPRHGQIYATHIERLRLDQAMEKITIAPELKLQPQQGGAPIALKAINQDKLATILHFWSPINQQTAMDMKDFTLTATECAAHKIAVVSVLVGDSPEITQDAEEIRKENQSNVPCTWVIDTPTHTLTKKLRVSDIPTMVLISNEGKILFNGHPSENEFWANIRKIAPNFKRPNNEINQGNEEE